MPGKKVITLEYSEFYREQPNGRPPIPSYRPAYGMSQLPYGSESDTCHLVKTYVRDLRTI
jgi:hypothetical protein